MSNIFLRAEIAKLENFIEGKWLSNNVIQNNLSKTDPQLGVAQKSYHSPDGGVSRESEKGLFYLIYNWKK